MQLFKRYQHTNTVIRAASYINSINAIKKNNFIYLHNMKTLKVVTSRIHFSFQM